MTVTYFLMNEALEAKDPKAVTQAEMDKYTAQLRGSKELTGFDSLEAALQQANEYDETQTANELFPVLAIEHRTKESAMKPAKVQIQVKADEQKELDAKRMPTTGLSLRKAEIYMPNGEKFVAAPKKASIARSAREKVLGITNRVANLSAPKVSRKAAFGFGGIVLAGAAVAALTFFNVPAMLGMAGLSLLETAGVSALFVAAAATLGYAAKATVGMVSAKVKAKKADKPADETPAVAAKAAKVAADVEAAKEAIADASNDAKADKKPAATIIMTRRQKAQKLAEEAKAPKAAKKKAAAPRKSPRLAAK